MRDERSSQDSAWKEVIHQHFTQFMEFYVPQLARELDFSRRLEFLDKELKKLFPGSLSKHRYADLLVKAALREEPSEVLYLHVEVQGSREKGFARRLFTYAYRIFERFAAFPVTLVVLTDADPAFHPSAYTVEGHGREVRVVFQLVKLIYYRERREELEGSRNLFAAITLMQLDVLEVKERLRKRRCGKQERVEALYAVKKRLLTALMRGCLERETDEERIPALVLFLDWLVQLPEAWEDKLSEAVEGETGGGEKMAYVTSWERRGQREGQLQGKREILMRLLSRKFSLGTEEKQKILQEESLAKLDRALDQIITAATKEEILKELD